MVHNFMLYVFEVVCSIIGLTCFLLSILVISKIRKLFPSSNVIKKWNILQLLIVFFIIGYIANIILITLELTDIVLIMSAFVYLMGGIFVLIIINLSYKTYKLILSSKK